jgi:predicted PilT family ATPase
MLMDKAEMLNSIQTAYDVRLDLSRANKVCKITGLQSDVRRAIQSISSIDSTENKINLDSSALAYLLGKGGEVIKSVESENKVHVDVYRGDENVDNKVMFITIIGLKSNVNTASQLLSTIIHENKEIYEEFSVDRNCLFHSIMGNKGSIIKQLQKDLHVALTKKSEDNDSSVNNSNEILVIRGIGKNVANAVNHLNGVVNTYMSECDNIDVPKDITANIVGKKGARISAIREKYPDVSVDIVRNEHNPDQNIIRIHCNDVEKRKSVIGEIQDIIDSNQTLEFSMNSDTIITFKGNKGTNLRNIIQKDHNLNMDIIAEKETIKLTGRINDIQLGVDLLRQFCDDNSLLEYEIDDEEDMNALFSGGKEKSLSSQIENRHNVELFPNRKTNVVRICGCRPNVAAAFSEISAFVNGDDASGKSVFVSVKSTEVGSLIGKGGNNINRIEKKFGVKIDTLRLRDKIRIRGETAESVQEAREYIILFLDEIKTSITLDGIKTLIEQREQEALTSPSTEKIEFHNLIGKTQNFYGVDIIAASDRSSVTISGRKRQIDGAKTYFMEQLSGLSSVSIPLLDRHAHHFLSKDGATALTQNVASAGIDSATYDSYTNTINLTGPTTKMLKAKMSLYRFLDFLYPSEFSSIPADSYSLRALWNSKTELDVEKSFPDVKVAFDMVMSCIRICGSNAMSVAMASDHFWKAVSDCRKRRSIIEINKDDEKNYEISNILATRKSNTLQNIEKKLHVTIKIVNPTSDSASPFVVINGENEDNVSNATEELKTIIGNVRKENWKISLTGDVVGLLIGKQGANIKTLRSESKANIDVDVRTGLVKVNVH